MILIKEPNSKQKTIGKFKNINKSKINYLSIPFINFANSKFIFSSDFFDISIPPCFSSLYKDPIIISILSFCNQKIHVSITENNENKNKNVGTFLRLRKNIFEANEQIQLQLHWPKEPKGKKEIQEYFIHFQLSDKLNDLSQSVKCKISTIFLPISVILSCDDISININENGEFTVNSEKFFSEEEITFKFKNYYQTNDKLDLFSSFQSLDENEISKPHITIKERENITIMFPKEEEKKVVHFQLIIYLSEKIKIPILFKGNIFHFKFNFLIWDFINKDYKEKIDTIYLPEDNENLELSLQFKVEVSNVRQRINGRVKYFNDKSSCEEEIINKPENIDKIFTTGTFTFVLKIKISKNASFKRKVIFIFGKKFQKEIELFFSKVSQKERAKKEFLKKFPLVQYIQEKNQWISTEEINEENFTISPFGEFLIPLKNKKVFYLSKTENNLKFSESDNKNPFLFVFGESIWYPAISAITSEELEEKINSPDENVWKILDSVKDIQSIISLFKQKPFNVIINQMKDLIEEYQKEKKDQNQTLEYKKKFLKRLTRIMNERKKKFEKEKDYLKILDLPNDYQNKLEELKKNFYKLQKEIVQQNVKEKNRMFLIQENKIPYEILKENKEFKLENLEKQHEESIQPQKIDYPDTIIEYPNESTSIKRLIQFYKNIINKISCLPIFARNSFISKDEQNIEKSEQYYDQLLGIFEQTPEKDYSLLSEFVNEFNNLFGSLSSKLQKVGVSLEIKKKSQQTEELLKFPEVSVNINEKDRWEIEDKKKAKNHECFPKNMNISLGQNIQEEESIIKQPVKVNKSSVEKEEKEEKKYIPEKRENPEKNVTMNDFYFEQEIKKILEKEKIQENEALFQDKKEENELENPFRVIANNSKEVQKTVESGALKENEDFREKDGIKRALKRIKEIDVKNAKISLDYKENYIPIHLNEKPNDFKFPINTIMDKVLNISSNFFKGASDAQCPYNNLCANILLDCSGFISDENKAFIMIIIYSLTSTFTNIEIPYSIALVGDNEFKVILKSFDDPHSTETLQKVFECFMIQRYRCKLSRAVKFSIDNMKCKGRDNRAFFIFSNGLDEQLALTSQWKEHIFNNSLNSFGFIFVSSYVLDTILTSDELQLLESHWENFRNNCSNGGKSFVYVSSIKPIINNDFFSTLYKTILNVLSRPVENSNKIKDISFLKPAFEISNAHLSLEFLDQIKKFDFTKLKGVVAKKSEKFNTKYINNFKLSKVDIEFYKPHLGKNCLFPKRMTKESDIIKIIQSIKKKNGTNSPFLEAIFKPNKPNQKILSSTGTEFDITALILNLINPVPEPLIYLEEKGGLIRNYGVTIVIDTSISCLNKISASHLIQTVREILSSLNSVELPYLDVIVTQEKKPIILSNHLGTTPSLSLRSELWESLLITLTHPQPSADLGSAINAAIDLERLRKSDNSSVLFVLTDGLFDQEEQKRIITSINNCIQLGISVFGIGVGIYPIKIPYIFPQYVFALNPSNVMKGIASFYGSSLSDYIEKILPLEVETDNNIFEIVSELISSKNKPLFKELRKELKNIPIEVDAFDDFLNEEVTGLDDPSKKMRNPEGKNTELYVKDICKSQKILIVMLWSKDMSSEESSFVTPDNLFNNLDKDQETVKSAVEFYGIDIDLCLNYEDAINKITHENNGFCEYYAVWTLCGPPYPELPNPKKDPNYHPDPYLVGQYIDVLILFWKNGGSLVFFAEGEPLTYQVNLFLEKAEFEGSTKSNLRIGGEHKGGKILFGDPSGKLERNQSFNRKEQVFEKLKRTKISHNLIEIFEGITISYAQNDYAPFIPFSKDSEGGISSLFYCTDSSGRGDIVIDCGFTKLFTSMKKEGTFRYIQNIAGWTAHPEIHKVIHNSDSQKWRPKAVKYVIDKNNRWKEYKSQGLNLKKAKTLFVIDGSGSVNGQYLLSTSQSSLFGKQPNNPFSQLNNPFLQKSNLFGKQINNMLDAPPPPTNNAGSTFSSLGSLSAFGSSESSNNNNKQSSLFGSSQTLNNNNQTSSLFGNSNNQPSSLFGNKNNQPSSLFGNKNNQPSSLFGSSESSNKNNQPSSLFGSSESSNKNNQSSSLFGSSQSSNKNNNQPSSLFGSSQSSNKNNNQPSSLFGSSQSSNNNNQPPSLFGNIQSSNNNNQPSSLFGSSQSSNNNNNQPPSLFGNIQSSNNNNNQPSSLFGSSQSSNNNNNQPSSLFGSSQSSNNNNNQPSSLFGSSQSSNNNNNQPPLLFGNIQSSNNNNNQPPLLFGSIQSSNNNNNQPSSLFGSSQSSNNNNNQPSSLFGNKNNQTSSLFRNSNNQTSSLFGNNNNQPSSLFGNNNNQPSSLFGNNNNQPSSLFGNSNNQPSSLFGVQNQQVSIKQSFSFGIFGEEKPLLYHDELKKIIDKWYKDGDIFYIWESKFTKKSLSEINKFISNREGSGGTSSDLIADIIYAERYSGIEHLVIVTDGQVELSSIDQSTRKMNLYGFEKSPYKFVSSYIIGEGGDLSVGAPYCRDIPNKAYEITSPSTIKELTSVSAKDLEILSDISRICSYSSFVQNYNSLDRAIQSKMLGALSDQNLISQLNDLKTRILSSTLISSNQIHDFNQKWESLKKMAEGNLRETFSLDSIAAAKRYSN